MRVFKGDVAKKAALLKTTTSRLQTRTAWRTINTHRIRSNSSANMVIKTRLPDSPEARALAYRVQIQAVLDPLLGIVVLLHQSHNIQRIQGVDDAGASQPTCKTQQGSKLSG